jgi:hypothetical protein
MFDLIATLTAKPSQWLPIDRAAACQGRRGQLIAWR